MTPFAVFFFFVLLCNRHKFYRVLVLRRRSLYSSASLSLRIESKENTQPNVAVGTNDGGVLSPAWFNQRRGRLLQSSSHFSACGQARWYPSRARRTCAAGMVHVSPRKTAPPPHDSAAATQGGRGRTAASCYARLARPGLTKRRGRTMPTLRRSARTGGTATAWRACACATPASKDKLAGGERAPRTA